MSRFPSFHLHFSLLYVIKHLHTYIHVCRYVHVHRLIALAYRIMKVTIIFYLILCRPAMLRFSSSSSSSSSSTTTVSLPLCRGIIYCGISRSLLLSKKLVIDRCISSIGRMHSRPPPQCGWHFMSSTSHWSHWSLARMRRNDIFRLSFVVSRLSFVWNAVI